MSRYSGLVTTSRTGPTTPPTEPAMTLMTAPPASATLGISLLAMPTSRANGQLAGELRFSSSRKGRRLFVADVNPLDLAAPMKSVGYRVEAVTDESVNALDTGLGKRFYQLLRHGSGHGGSCQPLVNAAAAYAARCAPNEAARSATGRSSLCVPGPTRGIAGVPWAWKVGHRFRWHRGGKAQRCGRRKRRRHNSWRIDRTHLHRRECEERSTDQQDGDETRESLHSVPQSKRHAYDVTGTSTRKTRPLIQFDGEGTSFWLKKSHHGPIRIRVAQAWHHSCGSGVHALSRPRPSSKTKPDGVATRRAKKVMGAHGKFPQGWHWPEYRSGIVPQKEKRRLAAAYSLTILWS